MKCPICGKDNNCAISHGKDPNSCWCHNVDFPKRRMGYKTCICKDCAINLKQEEMIEEIKEVEKRFMEASKKSGSKGWASFFKEEGVMILSGTRQPVIGKSDIDAYMHEAFESGMVLNWTPEIISFSDDYSLCYSTGQYERIIDGEKTFGKYLTIFRKEDDGWKVELDIGN